MSADTLVSLVRQVPTDSLIGASSYLSMLLGRPEKPGEEPGQIRAARFLFLPELAREVVFHLERGSRLSFLNQEQLLLMCRLAVVAGAEGAHRAEDWKTIGTILLGINDLIAGGRADDHAPTDQEAVAMILRALSFIQSEPIIHRIGRYFEMLMETGTKDMPRPSPSEVFEANFGISISQYLMTVMIWRHDFFELAGRPDGHEQIWDHGSKLLALVKEEELKKLLLGKFAASRYEFRRRFGEDLGVAELRAGNYEPFFDRPLFVQTSGSPLPVNLEVLSELAGPGLYWLLREAYSHQLRSDQAFTDAIGKLFQRYIETLLHRMYSPGSSAHFLSEAELGKYERDGNRVDPSDGMLIEGDRILVFECWSAPLSLASYMGDAESFRRNVRGDIADKFAQLDRVVSDLLHGAFTRPEIDLARVRGVMPVLVVLHPFPQYPQIWDVIRDEIEQRRLFRPVDGKPPVMELQIVAADDLELAEPILAAGGLGLSYLLVQKIVAGTIRRDSRLRSFLALEGKQDLELNPHLKDVAKRVMDLVEEEIKDNLLLTFETEGPNDKN